MNPTYPLEPVANCIASGLALLVFLTSQPRQPWNKGIRYLSIWVSISCLFTGVQTVIWRNSADTSLAPGFCDIATHIQVGGTTAIPACTLIICRYLYNVIRYQVMEPLDARKHRNELILDLSLVIVLPLITNLLYYVVQPYRFWVIEELGCGAPVVNSGLTVLLLSGPPLAIFFISLVYMLGALIILWEHKRSMHRLLGHPMAMTPALYLRLLLFGFILALISAEPFLNLFPIPHIFYPGWLYIHTDWAPVSVPAAEWHEEGPFVLFGLVWNGWINVWLSLGTFGLFGLTHDARAAYMRALRRVARWPQKTRRRRLRPNGSSLPRYRQSDGDMKLSTFGCTSSLDCTLPELPPAAIIQPASADSVAIKVAVTVERYADGDLETLAGLGAGSEEKVEKS